MGLDMYLEGKKFLWADYKNPEKTPKEDGFRLKEKVLELGYWRKHPNLHGYIVNTFANGVDECQPIELSIDDLHSILEAVKNDDLPETSGFFFGTSSDEDKEVTIEQINDAIKWINIKEEGVSRYVVYQASW